MKKSVGGCGKGVLTVPVWYFFAVEGSMVPLTGARAEQSRPKTVCVSQNTNRVVVLSKGGGLFLCDSSFGQSALGPLQIRSLSFKAQRAELVPCAIRENPKTAQNPVCTAPNFHEHWRRDFNTRGRESVNHHKITTLPRSEIPRWFSTACSVGM